MTTAQAGQQSDGDRRAVAGWLVTILVNIVLPTATYFVLAGFGMPDVPALLLSSVWPIAEVVWTAVRTRSIDEFGMFVLFGIAVGVITALVSHSAKSLFFKDSLVTGIIGAVFLVSLLGRPLTFYFGRRFGTDGSHAQREWWNGLWQYPTFRRVQRQLAAAWGIAMIGEAAIRAVLTLKLGTHAMVVANNVVPYVVIAGMVAVSITVGKRARAKAEGRRGSVPPTEPPTEPPLDPPAETAPTGVAG